MISQRRIVSSDPTLPLFHQHTVTETTSFNSIQQNVLQTIRNRIQSITTTMRTPKNISTMKCIFAATVCLAEQNHMIRRPEIPFDKSLELPTIISIRDIAKGMLLGIALAQFWKHEFPNNYQNFRNFFASITGLICCDIAQNAHMHLNLEIFQKHLNDEEKKAVQQAMFFIKISPIFIILHAAIDLRNRNI